MELTLAPDVEAVIEERIRSGQYTSAAEVVTAAILALPGVGAAGDLAPGELAALMAEGDASGPPVDGLAALAEFRRWRAEAARR
jgi:Arc/MetJ-type ribon-helix-helix transcriptional regulator